MRNVLKIVVALFFVFLFSINPGCAQKTESKNSHCQCRSAYIPCSPHFEKGNESAVMFCGRGTFFRVDESVEDGFKNLAGVALVITKTNPAYIVDTEFEYKISPQSVVFIVAPYENFIDKDIFLVLNLAGNVGISAIGAREKENSAYTLSPGYGLLTAKNTIGSSAIPPLANESSKLFRLRSLRKVNDVQLFEGHQSQIYTFDRRKSAKALLPCCNPDDLEYARINNIVNQAFEKVGHGIRRKF